MWIKKRELLNSCQSEPLIFGVRVLFSHPLAYLQLTSIAFRENSRGEGMLILDSP